MAALRTNLDKSPFLKRKLGDLPLRPGGCLYRDEGSHRLCVGKAKVRRNRVKSYFQQARLDAKTRRQVARIWPAARSLSTRTSTSSRSTASTAPAPTASTWCVRPRAGPRKYSTRCSFSRGSRR